MKKWKIALVDDHILFCEGLIELINMTSDLEVVFIAHSRNELIEKIKIFHQSTDIILMDVEMKPINGIFCTLEITKYYPEIKIIGLSADRDERTIIEMLKAGARAYLEKNIDRIILVNTIKLVLTSGYYYNNLIQESFKQISSEFESSNQRTTVYLSDREKEFMKYCCSGLTYKEIASKMFVGNGTVNGYRENLFRKLEVQNRVGIVIAAIEYGIVIINNR